MHATSVLLDGSSALGALLGVRNQPLDILTLARLALTPLSDLFAVRRHVITDISVMAAETPVKTALAVDGTRSFAHVNTHHQNTTGRRAVLEQRVVSNRTHVEVLLVALLRVLGRQKLAPSRVVDHQFALGRRAVSLRHQLGSLRELVIQVVGIATTAETMTTGQGIGVHA